MQGDLGPHIHTLRREGLDEFFCITIFVMTIIFVIPCSFVDAKYVLQKLSFRKLLVSLTHNKLWSISDENGGKWSGVHNFLEAFLGEEKRG